VHLHGVPGALDTEVVRSERGPTNGMNGPVVTSAGRHPSALDKELVVGQRVTDVVMPARSLRVRLGVVGAVCLDIAKDLRQRLSLLR